MSDDSLLPLRYSHAASEVEAELKDLFIKVYAASLAATADDIAVYGAPHLGSFQLVERNIDQDGLAVLRETSEDRIRYLFKAWRHRNPERGLHFLRLYLLALFGDTASLGQLWQRKDSAYPADLRTEGEIATLGESLNDYFLTSRVRVDLDGSILQTKLLSSLKSAVAARILLNVRVGRAVTSTVGPALVGYGANVLKMGKYGDFPTPPKPKFYLVTEASIYVLTEDGNRIILDDGNSTPAEPEGFDILRDESDQPITTEAGPPILLR